MSLADKLRRVLSENIHEVGSLLAVTPDGTVVSLVGIEFADITNWTQPHIDAFDEVAGSNDTQAKLAEIEEEAYPECFNCDECGVFYIEEDKFSIVHHQVGKVVCRYCHSELVDTNTGLFLK
jgi:Zn finger protein HypA/HybF involved in hydrogenase expression